MKRLLIAFIMVGLVFNIAGARKKDKAGKIDKGVYFDKKHDFSLVIPKEWNASIKKSKSKTRLILTKKQYDIPTQFQHAPSYTQVPRVTVYVDTTSMKLSWFIDSLLSDKYKSKQKSKMLQEFQILFGDYRPRKRSKMSVGKVDGIRIAGERRYTIQVQRAGPDADKADVVTDFFGGSMFFTKKDNQIYIFHFICEKRYFKDIEQDFVKLLKGFSFPEEEKK